MLTSALTSSGRRGGFAPALLVRRTMLAERGIKSKDLAEFVGITEANLSLLRQGKVKGMRFDTLEAICLYLKCEPGDLLKFVPGEPGEP